MNWSRQRCLARPLLGTPDIYDELVLQPACQHRCFEPSWRETSVFAVGERVQL